MTVDTELNDAGGIGEADQTIEVNTAEAASTEGYVPEGADAEAPPAETNYFDWDAYSAHVAKVSVNGEEVEVPIAELRNGYMRHADYTRKTQEVSRVRQEYADAKSVYEALQSDPQGFLSSLAEALGTPSTGNQPSAEDDYLDPTEQELRALKGQLAELQRIEQRRVFDSEVARLVDKFPDADVSAVVNHFANRGFPSLEAAYKDLAYESVLERQRELESKQKRDAEALAKKRSAAVVSSGSSPANGAVGADPTRSRSIHEAFELAKKQLGLSS